MEKCSICWENCDVLKDMTYVSCQVVLELLSGRGEWQWQRRSDRETRVENDVCHLLLFVVRLRITSGNLLQTSALDGCMHRFCNDCWRDHCSTSIRQLKLTAHPASGFYTIECPDMKCVVEMLGSPSLWVLVRLRIRSLPLHCSNYFTFIRVFSIAGFFSCAYHRRAVATSAPRIHISLNSSWHRSSMIA